MKLINKIFLGTAALTLMAGFQSCNDDDETTLEGAKTVYIEITPSDISLSPGDQLALSCRVTNGSGDVIDTPVTWSVLDETVAEIIPVYEEITEEIEVPVTGDDNEGDESETAAEGDTEDVEGDDDTSKTETITITKDGDFLYYAVRALKGSQGKQTLVRATLEDGRYAVAPLNVVSGSVDGALTLITEKRRSYTDDGFDTVWVKVTPVSLLEDCQLSYKAEFTKVYAEDKTDTGGKFEFLEGYDIVYGADVYDKPPYKLTENDAARTEMKDWVGVVYRAPRMVGEAVITVSLSDGESSSEVEANVLVAPKVSPGFEVNGERPLPQEPNPSNIKQTLINVSMDINSSYKLGVCLGVIGQAHTVDIENAIACEDNGLFKWDVNGSSVLVKGIEYDLEYPVGQAYPQGYVSYLLLESGIREGLAVITYTMPDQVLTCNLTVENFAVSHPVERVIIRELSVDNNDGVIVTGKELDERTFVIGENDNATLEILVAPEDANDFHEVDVVSSDPSIIEVEPKVDGEGYNRKFTAKKPGQAVITASALDKSKTMIAYVVDKVLAVNLDDAPAKIMKCDVVEMSANVRMKSETDNWIPQCQFTVDDQSIASIENVAGKPNVVRLTALAEGVVTLGVTCDGVTATPVSIEVLDSSDTTITTEDTKEVILTFEDEVAGLYITSKDSESDYDLFTAEDLEREDVYGDYEYEDIYVKFKGAGYSGAKLSFTVTADPDDDEYVFINGTVTLPNGSVVTFSNLRAILEQ